MRCLILVLKNPRIFQKNSVYPKTFYLYHHITRNSCRNRYTLIKKSYLHWRGIAIYLYSQLTKLLLISSNMNYPRKNLIYLKQLYTFQSSQRKFENPKSSLPLKRFIFRFLTTLNPTKPKVRKKRISRILLILTFTNTNLLHVYCVDIVPYETLGITKTLL